MDRHVIANMGAELGATTTVFPADDAVRAFLRAEGREDDFTELVADPDADYDVTDEIDLSDPRAADRAPDLAGQRGAGPRGRRRPRSSQVVIGSSANPGLRDYAIAARDGRRPPDRPRGQLRRQPLIPRQIFADLTRMGATFELITAGARIHQAGCMGCIGMGQAPATGRNSPAHLPPELPRPLRHRRRRGVAVLAGDRGGVRAHRRDHRPARRSPAQTGPRLPDTGPSPEYATVNTAMLEAPLPAAEAAPEELVKGPNIAALPDFDRTAGPHRGAGAAQGRRRHLHRRDLPGRGPGPPVPLNIPKLAEFAFTRIDPDYPREPRSSPTPPATSSSAGQLRSGLVAGARRDRPALPGPARRDRPSFARIHWQNLANFGILALEFTTETDYDRIEAGHTLLLDGVRAALTSGGDLTVTNTSKDERYLLRHRLSPRQVEMILAGGQIPLLANPKPHGEAEHERPRPGPHAGRRDR